MISISQFDEAQIISDYFGDFIGTFLDIGASNGVALSNTFQLGLKGWHGLLVEASPSHFQNLLSNYTHRGGFEMIQAALWHERKLMKFWYNQGFYSSLVYKDEPNLFSNSYWVQTVIAEDLKAIQPECDFLSLDIEGADLIVFPSLMIAYPNCKLVCCEHANSNQIKSQWIPMFERFKLKVISETPENYICAK